jgi:hypothetical protein
MPRVGFKPPNPAFERAKAVRALDRAAIVIGLREDYTTVKPVTPCNTLYITCNR